MIRLLPNSFVIVMQVLSRVSEYVAHVLSKRQKKTQKTIEMVIKVHGGKAKAHLDKMIHFGIKNILMKN